MPASLQRHFWGQWHWGEGMRGRESWALWGPRQIGSGSTLGCILEGRMLKQEPTGPKEELEQTSAWRWISAQSGESASCCFLTSGSSSHCKWLEWPVGVTTTKVTWPYAYLYPCGEDPSTVVAPTLQGVAGLFCRNWGVFYKGGILLEAAACCGLCGLEGAWCGFVFFKIYFFWKSKVTKSVTWEEKKWQPFEIYIYNIYMHIYIYSCLTWKNRKRERALKLY